jgi:hypothetical protein
LTHRFALGGIQNSAGSAFLDKRKLSADGRARMAKELSELAAAYRRHAAAVMRVVRGLRS